MKTIDEFFRTYGHVLVRVNQDDTETGDFRLFFPEERGIAIDYQHQGYIIASIFELPDGTEVVDLDNDTSNAFHKTGMFIITKP